MYFNSYYKVDYFSDLLSTVNMNLKKRNLEPIFSVKKKPISEEEEQELTRHRNRLDYLPDALELLKADFPEGYELIQDYFLREDKVTMWYLVEKYGLSIDKVRYRIKIAKQKLKEYIILHENE